MSGRLGDRRHALEALGHLDVAAVVGALGEAGYQGYLSFEIFAVPDALRAIRDGIAAVHAAMPAAVI